MRSISAAEARTLFPGNEILEIDGCACCWEGTHYEAKYFDLSLDGYVTVFKGMIEGRKLIVFCEDVYCPWDGCTRAIKYSLI